MNSLIKYLLVSITVICFAFSEKNNSSSKSQFWSEFEKSFVLIPSDSVLGKQVEAFYMNKFEVTNGFYVSLLNEIKKTDTQLYNRLLPDTLVWRSKYSYKEPYVQYYLRHPAYENYPVVGVTHEQAALFCKALTHRYKNENNGGVKRINFRLPTEREWMLAAGVAKNMSYPWIYKPTRLKRKKTDERFWSEIETIFPVNKKGIPAANFNYSKLCTPIEKLNSGLEAFNSYYRKNNKDSTLIYYTPLFYNTMATRYFKDLTIPVNYKLPSSSLYGIMHMGGNVEEYVSEKGITKGGSFSDPINFCEILAGELYDSTTTYRSAQTGFRIAMEVNTFVGH